MLIKEFSRPASSAKLNESLAKRFGTKIDVTRFTLEQLEDARNKLRTQLSQVETNESYDSVMKSDSYQKSKMFLDVINAAIGERSVEEAKLDPVGKEDDDVNNDGKKDSSDEYLKKRRAAIAKSKSKSKKNEDIVKEGAEEEATLVMASKDMVDRITGWMEDTAEMQTESMLELGDKIRDELGVDKSEEFIGTVKPALDSLFTALESTRDSLTSGVAILTGEGAPQTMGDEVPADDEEDMDMEPTVDADAEAEAPEGDDEFATADASVGGDEPADREKRESIELSKRLGLLLADSKKKV
jgi:hypothetical protein